MKTKITIVTALLLVSVSTLIITVENSKKEEKLSIIETKNMISYTLDGNTLNEKPTKESGYIANTISCENNTNIVWDNDNWEVEILNAEKIDRCNVDFTKDNTKEGYRITVVGSGVDSLSKTTTLNGKVIFYTNSEITNVTGCTGIVENGNLVIKNITSNQTCTITTKNTLYNKILADHPTVNTRTSFDTVLGDATATTGVIYKESTYKEDTTTGAANNKDVYYFAGNVADNWAKFAGYYWRIIRTNEDGGIRLLYHGTSGEATNSYIATSYAYNPTYNNTMYVGYMYGTAGSITSNRMNTTSSPIKTKLESWYDSNLTSYDSGVSKTAIYCNDRASGQYTISGTTYYATTDRLLHNESERRPSYQCGQATGGYYNTSSSWTTLSGAYSSSAANVADRFSKSKASGGNGKLSQPIGLMTADEVAFAGGMYGVTPTNTYYSLNSSGESSTGSYSWWTMSPDLFTSGDHARVYIVFGPRSYLGRLTFNYVDATNAIRPVISLKSCVEWKSGNGTSNSPYEVEVSETCALREN